MRILVTGGAGFIGSHLCLSLIAGGDKVVCLDNFINGNLTNIRPLLNHKHFTLVSGDIRDKELAQSVVHDIDVVVHAAAQIHVDRSIVEPVLTYETNVLGTLNILEAARRFGCKVVYISSSEVYGTAQYTPMDEKHPLSAPHPYGASKIAADRLCHSYIQTYEMDIVIVRPFNTFGPRQKDTGYGGAISIFVRRVLSGIPPIIYGDGTQTRDYLFVEDLVRALALVIKYPQPIPQPVNIGTGKEVRIVDLANMVIDLCGKTGVLKPAHVEPRPGEVGRLIAEISHANQLLSWEPKYSLQDGLKKLIDWYRNYKLEEWVKPG